MKDRTVLLLLGAILASAQDSSRKPSGEGASAPVFEGMFRDVPSMQLSPLNLTPNAGNAASLSAGLNGFQLGVCNSAAAKFA